MSKTNTKTNLKQGQNSTQNSPNSIPNNTLLERQGISPHSHSPDSTQSRFITALRTHSEGGEIAEKLENCGDVAMGVACNHCGYPHPIPYSCDLRICPRCSKKAQAKAVEKRKEKLSNMKNPKSLTLTIENIDGPVEKEDVDFIRDSYTKLRRRKPYKYMLDGSFYGIEPKHKLDDNGNLVTNLHLHTLVDMKYRKDACKAMKDANTPEAEKKVKKEKCATCQGKCLRYDWEDITGSPVVKLKDARNSKTRKNALYYVAGDFAKGGRKYIHKSITDPYVLGVVLVIIVMVLKNVRMIQATGSMLEGTVLKYRFKCPICGAVNWSLPFMWTEDHQLTNYLMRKEAGVLARSPP